MIVPSHMAWGYLLGSLANRAVTRKAANPYLLLLCGALPDFDLLTRQPYGSILGHHGIAHSWFAISIAFVPFFLLYRGDAFAYLIAVLQHPLFGDFVTNEIPLWFPMSLDQTGLRLYVSNVELAVLLEVLGFLGFAALAFVHRPSLRDSAQAKRSYLVLLSWVLLALTIRDAFTYFDPGTIIGFYAIYAFISSVALFILTAPVGLDFLRSFFRNFAAKG